MTAPCIIIGQISIHALREEGDVQGILGYGRVQIFLSTPSARRATNAVLLAAHAEGISIHALREEGDVVSRLAEPLSNISIHALREEGDLMALLPRSAASFLSTPSARRATFTVDLSIASTGISIHALREEGDCKNGEKHLRFCFIIKRSAQIWKSLSKNIRKKSRDLHRTA